MAAPRCANSRSVLFRRRSMIVVLVACGHAGFGAPRKDRPAPEQRAQWVLSKLDEWNKKPAPESTSKIDPSLITTEAKKHLPEGSPHSWENPGILVSGEGEVIRDAHPGTDGWASVDVKLTSLAVREPSTGPLSWNGDRFLRLELAKGTPARAAGGNVKKGQKVQFGGPVKIDHDGPWLEVHPDKDFRVLP